MLLGVVVWFYLDDTPAKAKWLTTSDKQTLQAMMEEDKLELVQPEGGGESPCIATAQPVA